MTELTSILLEFSEDDLSDTTPTWQDVTSDCQGIEWWSGVDNEGDEPQPGGAVIKLRNSNRRWEPDNTAGAFYPNVVYGRRFRLTLNDGTGATQEGLWYLTDLAIDYPAGTTYSEVTITCADGFEVLALDDLPTLDPPSAESYEDVVGFDEPWGYWRLGEPEGSKVVSHLRLSKRKFGRKGHRRRHRTRWNTRETIAELAGVSGSTGSYLSNPDLGQPGAILGDADTAVHFASGDRADIGTDGSDVLGNANVLSAEIWVKLSALATDEFLIVGPDDSGGINNFWLAFKQAADHFEFAVWATASSVIVTSATTVVADTWYHVAGTWDGGTARLYVNGALDAQLGGSLVMTAGLASSSLTLGGYPGANSNGFITLDEPAVFESVIAPERILAHYTAGTARGWPEQTAGTRIADIAAHALWSEASIQTTGRNVQPQMKHGQARLEEISELMQAEGPQTLFFFNGTGDPVYLGFDWKATSGAYNAVQATLGDGAGEVPYEDVELIYDNETFNVVEASREGGELVSVGAGGIPRRVNPDFTDLLLSDDDDVETIAGHVLDLYDAPAMRPKSVTVNGAHAVLHILDRKIGHLVRVRKRGTGGTIAIDRVTHILGYRKTLTADKHIACTWNLARGFNAALAQWQVGISGFSEIGQTTKVA